MWNESSDLDLHNRLSKINPSDFYKQYLGSWEGQISPCENVDQAIALSNHLREKLEGIKASKLRLLEDVIAFYFATTRQKMHERRVTLNQTKRDWHEEFALLYDNLLRDPERWGEVVRKIVLDDQREVPIIQIC